MDKSLEDNIINKSLERINQQLYSELGNLDSLFDSSSSSSSSSSEESKNSGVTLTNKDLKVSQTMKAKDSQYVEGMQGFGDQLSKGTPLKSTPNTPRKDGKRRKLSLSSFHHKISEKSHESSHFPSQLGLKNPEKNKDKDKYKVKLQKAIKLIHSLQKELAEYKKLSKVVQFLAGRKYNNGAREEMTEDIKIIISDLKEHIDLHENQELSMIKENFKKVIEIIEPQNKEKSKEIEEILENVIYSKSSKQNALRDFTDKIITTVEEVEEVQEEEEE